MTDPIRSETAAGRTGHSRNARSVADIMALCGAALVIVLTVVVYPEYEGSFLRIGLPGQALVTAFYPTGFFQSGDLEFYVITARLGMAVDLLLYSYGLGKLGLLLGDRLYGRS